MNELLDVLLAVAEPDWAKRPLFWQCIFAEPAPAFRCATRSTRGHVRVMNRWERAVRSGAPWYE